MASEAFNLVKMQDEGQCPVEQQYNAESSATADGTLKLNNTLSVYIVLVVLTRGLIVVGCTLFLLWRRVVNDLERKRLRLHDRVGELEGMMIELEYYHDEKETNEHGSDLLESYARRIHCGLILNGGFAEEEDPDRMQRQAHELVNEGNAANYPARRSLADLRSTSEQYSGHDTMLLASTQQPIPSRGPASRTPRAKRRIQDNIDKLETQERNLIQMGREVEAALRVQFELTAYHNILENVPMG